MLRHTVHIYCNLYVYINNFSDIYGSQLPLQHIDLNLNFVRRNSAQWLPGYAIQTYSVDTKIFSQIFFIFKFSEKWNFPLVPTFLREKKNKFRKNVIKTRPSLQRDPIYIPSPSSRGHDHKLANLTMAHQPSATTLQWYYSSKYFLHEPFPRG